MTETQSLQTAPSPKSSPGPSPRRGSRLGGSNARGFTLIEVLVVIGIIVLLVSILIPVVSKVKERAVNTSVKAQLAAIEAGVRAYEQTFSSLPGPIANSVLGPNATATGVTIIATAGGGNLLKVTGSENLTLGMLGGLHPIAGGPEFDPALVSRGPRGLKASNPRSNKAFLEGVPLTPTRPAPLKAGEYADDAGDAEDSIVPEMVDNFPDPMPILYLRATKGAPGIISGNVVTGTIPHPNPPTGSPATVTPQYDLRQIIGYTKGESGSIGVGKRINIKDYTTTPPPAVRPHGLQTVDVNKTLAKSPPASYEYPYNAFPYFQNRAMPASNTADLNFYGTPRNKDGFILISAGLDRVYGTADDVTNFGDITE